VPLTGAAAARLYDDHVDAVHALIARRVGAAAAPAITGTAFELALRTRDRVDPERGTERLFLYGIATKTLHGHPDAEREYLRSLRITTDAPNGDALDPLVPGQRSAPAMVVEHEANEDLRGRAAASTNDSGAGPHAPEARVMLAVSDLEPEDRDIVLLSLWESCPQSSIAEALELSVSSVRSALGRIRRELKIAATKDMS
jgi:RNA polymerase sigma factor (sigma-70 family)